MAALCPFAFSAAQNDLFPADYLSKLATFVASLSPTNRSLFHRINNAPTLSESQRVAQLKQFVAKLPKESKEIGMELLGQMCQLGSVLPTQPFLHFVAVFLQLLAKLDEERREKAMEMVGEQQQTDAEFEQKFVEFAKGFKRDEQKLMAIEFIRAKHAIRKHLLERLKMAKISRSEMAKKAKRELRNILLNLDLTNWEICWRLEEVEGMELRREDKDKLMYVLKMLKMKC
ncbi:hypothetical protein niasHT_024281 [Heterodera trifolii]|uniref:Uncharacterized protein n=1 Tax=Heterodera trifolii TaxID=157864 RepID=A0ABD2JM51_9BILA